MIYNIHISVLSRYSSDYTVYNIIAWDFDSEIVANVLLLKAASPDFLSYIHSTQLFINLHGALLNVQ